MKSHEHRAIGHAASGGALVHLGGECAAEGLVLGYGDVVALSGDYFTSDELFRLAAVPGKRGTKPGTRDEIISALGVMAVDEAVVDARFEPGGQFSFTVTAGLTRSKGGSGVATWRPPRATGPSGPSASTGPSIRNCIGPASVLGPAYRSKPPTAASSRFINGSH